MDQKHPESGTIDNKQSANTNPSRLVDFWDDYGGDFAGDILASEVIRLSKKYIGENVLDVGAGSGALISKIPNAVGVDVAPKNPKIIKGDILKLPFDDAIFDTVFAL